MTEASDVAICSGLGIVRGLSLCSGIGGLDLGLKRAIPSYRAICYVERDRYCVNVLGARARDGYLDDAPVWDDLVSFDPRPWRGCVDLVAAGYPCQPFSVAGKHQGADDPRHLWPQVFRIIRDLRPGVAFLENVLGHVNRGFRDVLGDLASIGFDAEWGIFSATETDEPGPSKHIRRRLFVFAYPDREMVRNLAKRMPRRRSGSLRREGEAILGHDGEAGKVERLDVDELPDCPACSRDGCIECEGLGYDPNKHPAARSFVSDVCRVAHGVPYRVDRLRSLGNAVVPAQAALAFRELAERATA